MMPTGWRWRGQSQRTDTHQRAEFGAQKLSDINPQNTAVAKFTTECIGDPQRPALHKGLVETEAAALFLDILDGCQNHAYS